MKNIFDPFWSSPSSEEQQFFYQESLFNFLVRLAPNSSESAQARSIAKEVSTAVGMFVRIYGVSGEEESVVVKCGVPEDNDGEWIMDVNFSVRGIVLQIVVRDRSISEMEGKFVRRMREMQVREEIARSQV